MKHNPKSNLNLTYRIPKGNIPWNKDKKGYKVKLSKKERQRRRKQLLLIVKKPEVRKKISDSRKGKKLPLEYRLNLSKSHLGKTSYWKNKKRPNMTGDKHPNWQGGKTSINAIVRHSLEYKLWRKAVFERDNYTCVWCGLKSGNGKTVVLNADHIKPFYLYPELRFAIDNGRTLCIDCHKTTNTFGRPKL